MPVRPRAGEDANRQILPRIRQELMPPNPKALFIT
jgi:hypothetical protein